VEAGRTGRFYLTVLALVLPVAVFFSAMFGLGCEGSCSGLTLLFADSFGVLILAWLVVMVTLCVVLVRGRRAP
jgi:hypothetical protein